MEAIITQEIDGRASVAIGTIERRDALILEAAQIRTVVDDAGRDAAIESIRALKALAAVVEATRKTVKAPVLELGKAIDAQAASVIDPLKAEEKRLTECCNRHEARRREIEAEQLRKQQAEAAKALREKIEAEAEIERKKKLAEAEADPMAKQRAQEEAERLELDLEMREMEAEAANAPALIIETQQPVGAKVSDVWDFEVIDDMAFARAFPDLVTFTLKRREILEAIKSGVFDRTLNGGAMAHPCDYVIDDHTIKTAPGLRIVKKIATKVR